VSLFHDEVGGLFILDVPDVDVAAQTIYLNICAPAYALLSLLPLLGSNSVFIGMSVDPSREIMTPEFESADFKHEPNDHGVQHINSIVKSKHREYMDIIEQLIKVLKEPHLSIPLLPMGLKLNVRISIELKNVLDLIQNTSNLNSLVGSELSNSLTKTLTKVCLAYNWTSQGDVLILKGE